MAKVFGRDGDLFARLIEPLHLFGSARAAVRGKRRRADVARFLVEFEPALLGMARALRQGTWKPGPYRTFEIREPKRRLISAATIEDRVIHHALVSILEPLFERRFVAHSYACRKGKGTHRALERAHRLARRHRFVLKGDVVKFFPSIDHDVVKALVRRVIADERFLDVLFQVLDASNEQEPVPSWHFPGDDLLAPGFRRVGLPIGNLTSQFLANVLLDPLDHFVMDDLGYGAYVRYCDDFMVFADDRHELWSLRAAIEEKLGELRLRLHERKGGVLGTRSPIPFLGFVLHGAKRRLPRHAVVRASRRLDTLGRAVSAGERPLDDLTRSVRAWVAHAQHGHTVAIRKRVLARAVASVPGVD